MHAHGATYGTPSATTSRPLSAFAASTTASLPPPVASDSAAAGCTRFGRHNCTRFSCRGLHPILLPYPVQPPQAALGSADLGRTWIYPMSRPGLRVVILWAKPNSLIPYHVEKGILKSTY
nr:hypothetical protein Itr_chr01CG11940 [Ipomoea trifida]